MASNGLGWALSMFGLDLVELLALLEVMFGDPHRNPALGENDVIFIYFLIAVVCFVLQTIGILLVVWGKYHSGGVLQIVSNVFHLPKGDGLIGVIGGIKAYQYAEALAAQQAAAANNATQAS